MRYASIDLETGGLDARYNPILEVGIIIEDTLNTLPFAEIPKKRFVVGQTDGMYCLQPFAARLNVRLLSELCEKPEKIPDYVPEHRLLSDMVDWIYDNIGISRARKITVAGKNFNGFDLPFFQALIPHEDAQPRDGYDWRDALPFHRRVLDPGSRFAQPGDFEVPNTETCLKRANLVGGLTHCAIDDAWDIIRLFRVSWNLGGDLNPSNWGENRDC